MYFLVNVKINRPLWTSEEFQRIVHAKDKNSAYDKTKSYLLNTYISTEHPVNKGFTFDIKVNDTII